MVSFRYEDGSEKGTPRGDKDWPYLVAEDWNADMPLVIDPRVVDLRREFHLCVTADKADQGDRCNRVSEMGKKEKEARISVGMMSHRRGAKGRGKSMELVLPKVL